MEVKDIIKKRREELGLTYEQLGNMVGVGKSTVRKWETGLIENMRRDNIVALSKALNISPAIIMGWQTIEDNNKLILSQQETTLLENYNKLNSKGKEKLLDYSDDLTTNIKYMDNATNEISATKDNVVQIKQKDLTYDDFETVAAHNDGLTDDEISEADRRILADINKRNKK
nr:MAG TPA: hypothetical protein [Caudoviricetes sp.]